MYDIIWLIPLLPLFGFLINGIFGKYLKNEALIGTIGSATVGASFVISFIIFLNLLSHPIENPIIVDVYEWIAAGSFSVKVSYQIDQLSILYAMIVTGVGFLIHIYSIGYMHKDRGFARFFAYMNLFIFMMLNLVLASNFLLTFLGWEGVGLCSYLLIGFWYDKKFEGVRIKWTGDAANKAFIVNRIGDFGFLIAMFLIYLNFGTLQYIDLQSTLSSNAIMYHSQGLITAITLLLFLGATGKSAQIPLAVWLPDAMAGPTPVSALIHAATMVTAGIFLLARNSLLFALSPTTMLIVAIVGTLTAFYAASTALVQNGIKKVLAYSTVSQLGYMFAALGVGAFTAAVFHVMTHAFFKGLLFLGAGSVMHGMHDEENIKKMGGLKKYMPATFKTFYIAALAISGIPLFSGFFSKDEILWQTFSNGGVVIWIVLAISAFFTAFYMFRLINLVFNGEERFDTKEVHPHESPAVMTIPLWILAVLSALGGFLGIPYALGFWFSDKPNFIENFLHPIFNDANTVLAMNLESGAHTGEYILMLVSIAIAVLGIWLAYRWYYYDAKWSTPRRLVTNFNTAFKILFNKYYLDEIYFRGIVDPIFATAKSFLWKFVDVKVIDGVINGTASLTTYLGSQVRKIQTGFAQSYAVYMIAGAVIILTYLLIIL
ncbi:MAG TPA: NADH-quinone oxidoreductase subunit L [Candidatus Kapabacteria bacterium]|jgi:NADH-quinone oxidoreductase subunit L|nr:NADH-quinone oxidoreductase subunit L [Candidatus Kapabacteria bacterium]HOV92308.1 NADH-quinone oxidoreductase subunit L [Candidatus Kapabacteria bacterium]